MKATNSNIIQLIQDHDSKGRVYTKKNIEFISNYTGQGGTKAESAGILHQYFTPDWVCDIMYNLAVYHGYNGGTILEPSVGTGNILESCPDKSLVTAFEPDEICHRITQIRHPEATIHKSFFETAFLEPMSNDVYGSLMKKKLTWLKGYPFELVISNPPYGDNANFYSGRIKKMFGKTNVPLLELSFMMMGVKLLQQGGLLIFLTRDNFMRNDNKYNPVKEWLSKEVELVDAYRLPRVFSKTQACPDIIIFRKKFGK